MQRQAAYARLMKAQTIARKFAPYVASGGKPEESPDYDEYCWLIGEFGEGYFMDELERFKMTKEEENLS